MHLRALIIVTGLLIAPLLALCASVPELSQSENFSSQRLPPSSFAQLPRGVVRYLQSRRCTIPQYRPTSAPHNVISGAFARKGQRDWAVLCHADGYSFVLVFWNGRADAVAEIACIKDEAKNGYGRTLRAVGRDYIISHYEAYKQSGAPKPPPIRHQGIEVNIMDKASVIYYYYRGKWLELQGAD